MKIPYHKLLSPNHIPIPLAIGNETKFIHLRKPTLKEIDSEIGFDTFQIYELFSTLTPKFFYEEYVKGEDDPKKDEWFNMTKEEKKQVTTFNLVINYEFVRLIYESMLDFFFEEKVIFNTEFEKFIFVKKDVENFSLDTSSAEDVCGIISDKLFDEIIDIIAQSCYRKKDEEEEVKFRGKSAQYIYEKINRNKKPKNKSEDKNQSLANIISKVSNRHCSLNPITVWDLTFFQLIDSFVSLQLGESFDMGKMSVSVWGDKENKFDSTAWYKNTFE